MPRRSSRRRSQATNGIDSSTIQALPTICPGQEIERAEGEPQEHDRIHHQPDHARRHHGDRPAGAARAAYRPRDRRIPREERGRRGDHQRRRREQAESTGAGEDRERGQSDAEPALHQIAQHQRDADHHHAGRRHQPGRHRNEARPVRHAHGAGIADQPVGRRDGQSEQQEKYAPFAQRVVVSVVRHPSDFHLAKPSARNRQAGHSPQP